MIIHNIQIENFKSLYGRHYFDFDKCKGLIKLSGPIGSGKTSLAEAIIYGLFGKVKDQNNSNLISWNEKTCEVQMNITSKEKEIHIIRNMKEPLIVEVNGKLLAASNKRDTQQILEEELFDAPKLAIMKMCIISFNQFNSLANMNPYEIKTFLDDVFGFKLFSEYNDQIMIERKNQQNENIKFQALYQDTLNQIENLQQKQTNQTNQFKETVDIDNLNKRRNDLVAKGVALKKEKEDQKTNRDKKVKEYDAEIRQIQAKITETITLGKQAKNNYNTFKSGICPTCGKPINKEDIESYKNKMIEYANIYKEQDALKNIKENEKEQYIQSAKALLLSYDDKMDILRKDISKIDIEIRSYNDSIQLIQENYDNLINELNIKLAEIKEKLDKSNTEINEWDDMNVLFTKTLRYNLLETLIPHINKSIQFFINKLDQSYQIKYDQEFKAHIFVDSCDKEIPYTSLSTGQKKTLDLAIIFGILQNIISTIDVNILFLDELMSNMDTDTRNIMLALLNETMSKDKSVFIVNHSDMADDMFNHKIRVRLENRKMIYKVKKEDNEVLIKCSKYEQIF